MSSAPLTNQHFYDRISHMYDMIADANEHAAREQGERALDLEPGERALEVGFGTGNSLIHLARTVGNEGHVTGIDVSVGMRDVTATKLEEEGLQHRVNLLLGDARQLPCDDNSFDAALTTFTLELFPLEDIPVVLSEISRVLRPGGRIAVVSMALVQPGETDSLLEKTYKWMHRHFPHLVDCQPIDPARSLQMSDFEVESERRIEIWTMPVAIVLARKPMS